MTIYHSVDPNANLSLPDSHQDVYAKSTLGFWMYLMTDCLLFGTLFATYAVLKNSTFGGPTSLQLFNLKDAFIETMILLFSSVTCGLSVLSAVKSRKTSALVWLGCTFILGASFIFMELREFSDFIEHGSSWQRSAFLSAFFTLVGTHGLHVTTGLLWLSVVACQLIFLGINIDTFRRLVLFSMFWHFLDLIWIFIFTFVYLMGVI